MAPETTTYIYIGTTLIACVIYYLTFKFQARKIDVLEIAIKSQSTLISDFEKFKSLLDVEHYIKNRDLQLENQKIEMTRYFEKEAKAMGTRLAEGMNNTYMEINKDLLASVNELIQVPLSIIMTKFPDKSQKADRDNYIKEKFPHSTKLFIDFCDTWVAGQITPR